MDKGDTAFGQSFIVFAEATIEAKPSEGAFPPPNDGAIRRNPFALVGAGQVVGESENVEQPISAKSRDRRRQPR